MESNKRRVISLLVDNQSGVLARVSNLFCRRGFNIDSLTVSATNDPAVSRITVTITSDDKALKQLILQTERLEVTRQVFVLDGEKSLERELLLLKVASDVQLDLLNKRFVVFEIDEIKEHKILFPVVTVIIMEAFINKMRRLHGVRKMIVVEEAWKAIAREGMADYIKFLYKTVRKYFGEAVVVTQELDDIVSSPLIKDTIINNADCKILLDQRKYINKFDSVQSLLGLTDKEKGQILSINQSNDPARKYKEV